MFDKINPLHVKKQDRLDVLAGKLEYTIGDDVWWCDGIYLSAVPIEEFLKLENKDIVGSANIEELRAGGTYELFKLVLMFGEKAVKKYTEVESLLDCIQEDKPQEEWLHIDIEEEYMEIQLY